MNPEIEAHLRSLVNFPSPPGVATHIIELARDPDIEMGKVAKALSMDSALSTKILRIANSPLYAQRRKSENLRQALVVLGLNATLTLALELLAGEIAAHRQSQRHQLSALLAARADRGDRGARPRRRHASVDGRRDLSRRSAAGCGHPGLGQGDARSVSRRRLLPERPRRPRRARKEAPASRSCRDRRLADAKLELARTVASRDRAQPSHRFQRRPPSPPRSSNAASHCQGRSRICSCASRSTGTSPRPRCAPSAASEWTRWPSDRCSERWARCCRRPRPFSRPTC